MNKTYGYKTLISLAVYSIWMHIIIGEDMKIFLPSVIGIIILSIIFVPLIRVTDKHIRFISLNPFGSKLNIKYSELERMHIYAGNIQFKLTF